MAQSIGQKFTPLSLLKFAFPSMVMMVFMSFYTIVDGIFVSRFSGSDALSSINIVYPVFNLVLAVGIMLATGGSALVGKKLGEGKKEEARENFTMLFAASIAISFCFVGITLLFSHDICYFLGSDKALFADCKAYLCTLILFAPACMLQSLYQSFLVTAGKPHMGLGLIIGAGVTNAVLDYVFMAVFGWGVTGAALATGIGQMIPAVVGTLFFLLQRKNLYLVPYHFHKKDFLKACGNGSSEMVTQISNAVITLVFNLILMRMAGSDGVAAITIILYGQFMLSSLYLGFSMGVAPIFSFYLGAKKYQGLKSLHTICKRFVLCSSLLVTAVGFFGAEAIVGSFVPQGSGAYGLAVVGFRLFAIGYLFNGVNIYFSGLFTALSDGKTSAILSFSRTFGFILASLLLLPLLIGIYGVWLAIPLAEFLTVFLAIGFGKKRLPM
jgi:putative MATE family efflux protein